MFENLESNFGKVVFNDFDINKEIPLESQIDSLKEDMLQINFLDKYIIDIGWYPEFNTKGTFRIEGIKNYNWEKPIYSRKTRDLKELEILLNECISLIDNIVKNDK